jgi:hypothetical protein
MCDEREGLIDYLYDEADPAARREFERHLETCASCRDEVRGFGAVRTDLLAWEVPESDSVWKPFAPPRPAPWWREVPAWAMAAAAAVIFAIGAAGGAATRTIADRAAARPASIQQAAMPAQVVPTGVSRADLDAFGRQLSDTMRSEMDARVRLVSTHASSRSVAPDQDFQQVRALLQTGDQRDKDILNAMRVLNNDFIFTKSSQDRTIEQLKQRVDQLSNAITLMAQQQAGGKQ